MAKFRTPEASDNGSTVFGAAREAGGEKVPAARKYIVAKAFQFYLNGMLGDYPAGLVIDRPYLVDQLLAVRAPIVPADSISEVAECPYCNKKFIR